MAQDEQKTAANAGSVADHIAGLGSAPRSADAAALDALFRRVTGCAPKMWGPSIIGYGSYRYKYESGREGTMCRAGFAPRKAKLVIYAMGAAGEAGEDADLLARLGKHKTGKGCLYIRKLADVDFDVLETLVRLSWERMNAAHPV